LASSVQSPLPIVECETRPSVDPTDSGRGRRVYSSSHKCTLRAGSGEDFPRQKWRSRESSRRAVPMRADCHTQELRGPERSTNRITARRWCVQVAQHDAKPGTVRAGKSLGGAGAFRLATLDRCEAWNSSRTGIKRALPVSSGLTARNRGSPRNSSRTGIERALPVCSGLTARNRLTSRLQTTRRPASRFNPSLRCLALA